MIENRKKVIVYGLASSEDGKIRYVGQTIGTLKKRLWAHMRDKDDTHKANWVRSVRAKGNKIQVFAIESDAVWNESEIRLIAWYRKNGADLTNSTDGGDGILNPSKEVREKISRANKGNVVISPEQRAKMVAGLRAREWSDEHRATNAAVCRARNVTAKQRGHVSRAKKGKKVSPEALKNMSLCRIGKRHAEQTKEKTKEAITKMWADPKHRADRLAAKYRRAADALINERGV